MLKNWIIENGLLVLNGKMEGDENGKFTYIGNGTTVIDYRITDRETYCEIENFMVGEKAESDHMPLEIRIKNDNINFMTEKREKNGQVREVIDLSEQGIAKYIKKLEKNMMSNNQEDIEWKVLFKMIKKSAIYKKIREQEDPYNEWWYEEYEELKEKINKELRRWKR